MNKCQSPHFSFSAVAMELSHLFPVLSAFFIRVQCRLLSGDFLKENMVLMF